MKQYRRINLYAKGGLTAYAILKFAPEFAKKHDTITEMVGEFADMSNPLLSLGAAGRKFSNGEYGSGILSLISAIPGVGLGVGAAKTALMAAKAANVASKSKLAGTALKAGLKTAGGGQGMGALFKSTSGKSALRLMGWNNFDKGLKGAGLALKGGFNTLRGLGSANGKVLVQGAKDLVSSIGKTGFNLGKMNLKNNLIHMFDKHEFGGTVRYVPKAQFGALLSRASGKQLLTEGWNAAKNYVGNIGRDAKNLFGIGSKDAASSTARTASRDVEAALAREIENESGLAAERALVTGRRAPAARRNTAMSAADRDAYAAMAREIENESGMAAERALVTGRSAAKNAAKKTGRNWKNVAKKSGKYTAQAALGAGALYGGYRLAKDLLGMSEEEYGSMSPEQQAALIAQLQGGGSDSGRRHRRDYSNPEPVVTPDVYDSYIAGAYGHTGNINSTPSAITVLPNENRTYTSGTNGYYVTMPDVQ